VGVPIYHIGTGAYQIRRLSAPSPALVRWAFGDKLLMA